MSDLPCDPFLLVEVHYAPVEGQHSQRRRIAWATEVQTSPSGTWVTWIKSVAAVPERLNPGDRITIQRRDYAGSEWLVVE